MRKPSCTAKKRSRPGTNILFVVLLIGGIALSLKPSITWIKGQLLHMEGASQHDSIKEQNRLNWCADVLESDNISESDYSHCEDFWKY